MSEHKITVPGGTSVRLLTAGKFCDRDILVTAEGGGVELPALTDPAEENDVRRGKEYIDGEGNRRYGALYMDWVMTPGWEARIPVGVHYDSDDRYLVMTDGSAFGNATPSDVPEGITFSSREGVALVGTMIQNEGVELPTLTDPAAADEVLLGKEIIDADGEKVTGTMPNHAGNSINLSPNYLSYTIPKGYHPGTGRVSVGVEQKTVIPSDTGQIITPTGIKFLRSVTVEPIPEGYMVEPEITEQDTLLAELATVLQGKAGGAGGGDPDLPSGYMRCDYIRFSGEQTIDTGIVCNQNTKIRVLFTRDSDTSMYMYGVVNSGNTASVTAYLTSSGGSWRFGNKYSAKVIVTNEDLVQTAIVTKTGFVRADDTVAISGVNDFETIGTLILGAVRNADGSVAASRFIGKILLFEMWQGDTEVLHLSPIVSTSGVYRFYDEVSQTFFDSTTDVPLEGGNL